MSQPAHQATASFHRGDVLVDVAKLIRDLVEPSRHVQRYDRIQTGRITQQLHWTRHPSLIEQLRAAQTGRRTGEQNTGGYESRPAARLEALDVLRRITVQCTTWITHSGRLRRTLEDNLRALVGVATRLDDSDLPDLAGELRSWTASARIVTGWDTPPWRPNVECPACERKGGLRIRLDEKLGTCLHCQAVWEPHSIGLLADLIAAAGDTETANEQQARDALAYDLTPYFPRRGPCLCGTPDRPHDARHRAIDALLSELACGVDPVTVAAAYGVPVDAVQVAASAAETFPDLEPYQR